MKGVEDMNNRIISVLCASALLVSFTGCNKNNSDVVQDTTEGTTVQTSDTTEESVSETTAKRTTRVTRTTKSSTTTATTTSTTTEAKKKSAFRTTSASTDKTYRGQVVTESGGIPLYKSLDDIFTVAETLKNYSQIVVSDYRISQDDLPYFKLQGHKGWTANVSCPLCTYISIGIKYSRRFGDNNLYATYDIDNDGTAEWIFQIGSYSAQYAYEVYTVKGNSLIAEYIGSIPYGTLYADDKGNLVTNVEKMGYETAYQVEYHNGSLNTKIIYENSGLDEYTIPGTPITEKTLYDLVGDSKRVFIDYYGDQYDDYIETYENEPNIECQYCGYGFYYNTRGIDADGLKCPECGKYIVPPDEVYEKETINSDNANKPTYQYVDWTTEYVEPPTDAQVDPVPVTPDPVEPDPVEPNPVEPDPAEITPIEEDAPIE